MLKGTKIDGNEWVPAGDWTERTISEANKKIMNMSFSSWLSQQSIDHLVALLLQDVQDGGKKVQNIQL